MRSARVCTIQDAKTATLHISPGISTADNTWTKEELENVGLQAKQEARQQYAERQAEKFDRLAKYSLDEENQRMYASRKDAWKETVERNRERQLEDLEKQFTDMAEGYSYDDFVKDFGSVEEGFEGAEKEEIEKAKEIADKIKELRGDIKPERTIRTKEESIQSLKMIGIDFKDNSANGISGETANKFADFITNFEQSHAGYFVKNESRLKSITVVDKIEGQKGYATGIYRSKTKAIEIKTSGIKSKQSAALSRSDDFEMHGLAHEYGHYIADNLEENLGVTEGDIVQRTINKYFDGDIFKSTKDLKDCLSAYGSTNYDEAFAEAFAEAYTCNEPGEFAKIFKGELENALNTSVVKSKHSGIIKAEREMANGMRKSFKIPLSENEKNFIRKEIEEIGATQEVFVFRDGLPTGYSDERDIIFVSSSVFPPNDGSTHPTDRLSVRATLAHEYYGHRVHRNTKLPAGAWNDEFRASYSAAKNCPNLTDEDRASLIADAIERANKAGVTIKLNSFMRRCLYGYE